jgi:hypothetical protein
MPRKTAVPQDWKEQAAAAKATSEKLPTAGNATFSPARPGS